MWGLIIGACILVVAIGLRIDGRVDGVSFSAMLTLALVSGIVIAYYGSTKKLKAGLDGIELETFRKDVNSVKEEAMKELRKDVVELKDTMASVIEKADKTRKDLLSVAEAVAPPYLSLESKQVERTEEGYKVTLRFNPSKNEPFGTIVFRAEIIGDSEAIIKQLTCEGMHFSGKEQVSTDGKTAIKQYASPGVRQEKIILTVSAPCKVRISGSHMREKLEFEVK